MSAQVQQQQNAIGAFSQSVVTDGGITGFNSGATEQMLGLGVLLTPIKSGRVLVIISLQVGGSATTAATGVQGRISYGTGSAPSNNGALAGTQVGTLRATTTEAVAAAAGDIGEAITYHAVIDGLTTGTAYWFDLSGKATGGVTSTTYFHTHVTIQEF